MKTKITEAVKEKNITQLQQILSTKKPNTHDLTEALRSAIYTLRDDKDKSEDSKTMDIVKLLLDEKADPNGSIIYSYPASIGKETFKFLTYAIYIGHLGLVKALVAKGASLKSISIGMKHRSTESLIAVASQMHLPIQERIPEAEFASSGKDEINNVLIEFDKRQALITWHLFVSGAPLWESHSVFRIVRAACCIDVVYNLHSVSFMFLTALNSLWISEKRNPIVSSILTSESGCSFIPEIANIIMEYSDDNLKDYKAVEQQIVEFKAPEKLEDGFSQEETIPPLITAATDGDDKQVKSLLAAKADPTVCIKGNNALMWAILKSPEVPSESHISAAVALMENLGKKTQTETNSYSFCTIS